MRKMKDSGIKWIGEIPEEWAILSHKNIMFKKKELCNKYNGEDILSLTLKGIIKRDLENPSGKMPATFDGYQKIDKGNLLLCLFDIDVTPRCVGLINHDGLTSPAYSQFVMKNNNNSRFYNYLLRMIDNDKCFLHLSKNLRSSLTETDFGLIKSIMPPLEEQELIADYLDEKIQEIDNIISKTQETIEEYKKYKQSVITEAVTKGLNPNVEMKDSGIEWIGEIPKHWDVRKINNLFNLIGSGTTPKSSEAKLYDGNINWIQSGDINGGTLYKTAKYVSQEAIDNISTLKIYKNPFIVMAMYGASIANISLSYIDGCVNQACCVLSSGKCDIKYVFYALKASKSAFLIQSVGGTQPNISQEIIKSFRISIPNNIIEQNIISSYLDKKCNEIDNLITKKQELISQLETYKKSLIYECVTGKKEVSLSYAD